MTHTLTRRRFLAAYAALPFSMRAFAARSPQVEHCVYIGTDTSLGGKGIYRAGWEGITQILTPADLIIETPRPSYLAASPDRSRLYAVNALNSADAAVSSFTVQPDGSLALLNSVPSGGNGPCFISIHPSGRAAYVANYYGGSLSSYSIAADGTLSGPTAHFQYEGHGPVAARQQSPHAHSCTLSPDARWLLVNDLGLDAIHMFRIDSAHPAQLTHVSDWHSRPGAGPRHLVFTGNGYVYCINEIDSTIDLLRWDWDLLKGTCTLTTIGGPYSTTAPGFTGANTASEILLSPGSRFLYASNRGEDSIAVFSVDFTTGVLKHIQHIPSGGRTPRHITLTPPTPFQGSHSLIVANQDSSNICVFHRDGQTGLLTALPHTISVPFPMFVLCV